MARHGTRRRFLEALSFEEPLSRELVDEELRRRRAFDPTEAAARAGRAAWETFQEDLGRQIERLRGQQVRMGRLRTGFGTEDEDRLVQYGLRDLNRALARNALAASQLGLRNIEGLSRTAALTRGRYLDLLAGQRDWETAMENLRRAQRFRRRGALGGVLGLGLGALGGALIPGVGTLLGAELGSLVGSRLGYGFS